MLTIKREDRSSIVVLTLTGHLDALTVDDMKAESERVLASQAKWCVLDLAAVDLVDSTGIGSIIALFKRLKALGGDLKVSGVTGQPKEIFDVLRLERALSVHPNVDHAIASFAK